MKNSIPLSPKEELRYHKQISLTGFDFTGQSCLKRAKVTIIGLGGLGCAASQYLTIAGIGSLTLIDFDHVTVSNLQRQVLYTDSSIGIAKTIAAKDRLKQMNPFVHIKSIVKKMNDVQLATQISRSDVVLDCTDYLSIRKRLNYICYNMKVPLISGSAIRMEGQLAVFTYKKGEPCYHCLGHTLDESQLSCSESGIMAPLVGIIGAFQALEAIKLLTSYGTIPHNKVYFYDALVTSWHILNLTANPNCQVCSLPAKSLLS